MLDRPKRFSEITSIMIFLFLLVFISRQLPVFCINKEVITLKNHPICINDIVAVLIGRSWYCKFTFKVNGFKWFKKILFDNGMPNEMRIPGYHNADMFFTIDRWMSEYIEMIGDLIGKNTSRFIRYQFQPRMTSNKSFYFFLVI